MNKIFSTKVIKALGYNLDVFLKLPKFCQEKIILVYLRGNLISLSKEELDFIFQNRIDGIIEREHQKKELIKKIIK